MKNRRLLIIVIIIGVLMFIPLIAMQFTNELNWDLADFILMGILLLCTGFACELVLRNISSTKNKIVLCGIILAMLIIIWAEFAVGIFGTPVAGS